MSIGGGGGENFRPYYRRGNSFSQYSKRLAKKSALYPWLQLEIARDMDTMLTRLSDLSIQNFDPLILHYQFYRNRLHVGHGMETDVQHMPLGSRFLFAAGSQMDADAIGRGQILYDIMHNCAPGFLEFPFDSIDKSPNQDTKQKLTILNPVNKAPYKTGDVFIGTSESDTSGATETKCTVSHFHYLQAALDRCLDRPFVRHFFGHELVDRAVDMLSFAAENGYLEYPAQSKSISAMMATSLFDPEILE